MRSWMQTEQPGSRCPCIDTETCESLPLVCSAFRTSESGHMLLLQGTNHADMAAADGSKKRKREDKDKDKKRSKDKKRGKDKKRSKEKKSKKKRRNSSDDSSSGSDSQASQPKKRSSPVRLSEFLAGK